MVLGCTVAPRGIGIRGSGDPFFLSPEPPIPSTPPPPLRGALISRSLLRKFFVLIVNAIFTAQLRLVV